MLQAKAILNQQIANQAYETITAPFDGIVTSRNVDPGHLVPAADVVDRRRIFTRDDSRYTNR